MCACLLYREVRRAARSASLSTMQHALRQSEHELRRLQETPTAPHTRSGADHGAVSVQEEYSQACESLREAYSLQLEKERSAMRERRQSSLSRGGRYEL